MIYIPFNIAEYLMVTDLSSPIRCASKRVVILPSLWGSKSFLHIVIAWILGFSCAIKVLLVNDYEWNKLLLREVITENWVERDGACCDL